MSERDIARRLRIVNRLEELRAKYGRDIEEQPMPDWLDHMPEHLEAEHYARPSEAPQEDPSPTPPPETVPQPSPPPKRPTPRVERNPRGKAADW